MDFDLSPEQQEIHKLANDFADREIAPGARERDRAERFPWDVLKKMAPIGFLGGPIPEEYGGMGVDFISHAIITEAISPWWNKPPTLPTTRRPARWPSTAKTWSVSSARVATPSRPASTRCCTASSSILPRPASHRCPR